MSIELSPSAQRVQAALQSLGLELNVVEMPASTRTAPEAAAAVGCEVGQIVKSLVFKGEQSGKAILIAASGANRVNEKSVAAILGEPIAKADADFVRQQTGFVIGGVPPLGHIHPLTILVDEDLMQYSEIWAAAGTPNAVFRLAPQELVRMTNGLVTAIK
jgi:prolyl-tRNA editing enzyme YbaK/EbsC (Cys-tRNA(Pro) deacylase)